jgi:CheY-like chemotaxis protein
MNDETGSRIFEPFFTTKFQGRGLGMAAVFGIVKNHGGWIDIESQLGQGTTVRIYLPVVDESVKAAHNPIPELEKGAGTILVIEDEDDVMEVSREILKRLGYRVLEAKTGTEAVNLAGNLDVEIDVAILDIGLPDLTGDEVFKLIKEARPDLKVVVCSGYAIDGPAQEILDAGAQGFIQKPYAFKALSAKIKEVLKK